VAKLWNNLAVSSTGTARTQVLTAAVLFGTTGTAQALGPDIEPLAVGTARIVVGAALLAIVAAAAARRAEKARGPAPPRPLRGGGRKRSLGGGGRKRSLGGGGRKRSLRGGGGRTRSLLGGGDRRLVLLAGVFVAAYQASFFAAVAETGVAVGTVVALGSAPAWTGLFGRVFTGERLGRRWFGATGLACAGVVLLTLGASAGGTVSVPGVALALASGAGYAGYAVAGKRLLDRGGTPEGVMAAVFGTGALVLLPALALVPTANLFTAKGIALAAYLGVLPTAVAYVLFARGLSRIGAGETATLTLAEPVTAMALGFVVLGERPGAAAAAGAALVLAGLAALALRPQPKLRIRSRPAEASA
jgi:DME family drug/metabolite transporter